MCGIFAFATKTNLQTQIGIEGLKTLEYRGYDSWGMAYLQGNQLKVTKDIGKIGNAKTPGSSRLAIGHTRWATHGGVTKENAHPHLSCDERFAVAHNGIIENFQDLKTSLLNSGHTFCSETDTEVVAHLLEEALFFDVFSKLAGLNALIVLDKDKKMVLAAKNGSPLVVGVSKKGNFLASDALALLPHAQRIYHLKDNEGVVISSDRLKLYNLKDQKELLFKPKNFNLKTQDVKLSGYQHFLIQEIMEQPQTLRILVQKSQTDIENLSELIRKAYGTYFIGSGTAYHAALVAVYLLAGIARCHVNSISASEFCYLSNFITRGSLLTALTQSGETIDVIEALKLAKNKGATLAVLTNVLGSSADRESQLTLSLRAGPEKAVLATKSYLAKLTLILLTAYGLNNQFEEGKRLVLETADYLENFLMGSSVTKIKNLAKILSTKNDLYLIGRGKSSVDALEGALKIKEVSYLHAEGFAGGDLKHGPIALIEKGTPVIVFAPLDETYAAILSNAMEVKARGAFVVGISPKTNAVFDEWIKVADVGWASNLVNIVPVQLLSYFLALERGCDPDKPRNLAKSVTVR